MAKYSGKGWHFQSTRHSNARKYGKAGGKYRTPIYAGDKLIGYFNIVGFKGKTLKEREDYNKKWLKKYHTEKKKHYGKTAVQLKDASWLVAGWNKDGSPFHEYFKTEPQADEFAKKKKDEQAEIRIVRLTKSKKETKEELQNKELYNKKELSEKELNLIKLRLNSGKITIQELKRITQGERYELSEAQAQKGLAWLRNKGFKMNGEPRSKSPFGYREEAVVTKPLNETKFYLTDFYEENGFHYPVYVIKNSGGAFEYYVKGGEIKIIG